jgi:hypothetical protein
MQVQHQMTGNVSGSAHARSPNHCALCLVGGKRRSRQSGSQGIRIADDNSDDNEAVAYDFMFYVEL